MTIALSHAEPDEPAVTGVVLDPGEPPARPIIPTWMRNPHDLRSTGVNAIVGTARTAAFHTIRAPRYWAAYAVRAPQGSARLIGSLWRWAVFTEGLEARKAAKADPDKFHRLTEQRQAMVRARMFMVGLGALAAGAGAWWVITQTSWPVAVFAVMFLLLLLGLVGKGKPIIIEHATTSKLSKPSQDLILNALASLGLPKLKRGEGAKLTSPVVAAGDGWHARIALPPGMLAAEVIAKRPEMASGLARPVDCVWLEGNAALHPGILDLWVGNHRMIDSPTKPWPYAAAGEVSLFEPFVFGQDPRGRPVSVTLMFASGLIGALPRMGKSELLRIFGLAAALDRTAELHIYDLKGGADFIMFGPVAEALKFGSGDDTVKAILDDVQHLDEVELPRRYETIRNLDTTICPESKITPELAADPRYGLHPIILILDEAHLALDHPRYGNKIKEYVTDLVKRAPAAGIIVLLATQRPDAASIPTSISAHVVLRWCLKVLTWRENNLVLGDGANDNGIRATEFANEDKGICYFAGEGRSPTIVRASRVDAKLATKIVARAAKLRSAPELTAEPGGVDGTILDDLAAVWPAGQEKVWWVTLAELLATRRPGLYGGLKGVELARMVQEHRLPSIDIHRGKATRKGCARIALDLVLEQSGPPPVGEWPRFDSGAALRLVREDDRR